MTITREERQAVEARADREPRAALAVALVVVAESLEALGVPRGDPLAASIVRGGAATVLEAERIADLVDRLTGAA